MSSPFPSAPVQPFSCAQGAPTPSPTAALYAGVDPASQSASSHTAYKWSFAARADADALRATRNQVSAATYGPNASTTASPPGPAAGAKIQGPTLPTSADLLLAREAAADELAAERTHKRKRARAEDRLREEDAVGPREPGREGQLERKRVKREADKSFRERGDDGFPDVDESALMGGDSFKDQCVASPFFVRFADPLGFVTALLDATPPASVVKMRKHQPRKKSSAPAGSALRP